MTTSHNPPEKCSRSGPIAALVVVGLLLVYQLSGGPMLYATARGWLPISAQCLRSVHSPARLVANHAPEPLCGMLESYNHWWFTKTKQAYSDTGRIGPVYCP